MLRQQRGRSGETRQTKNEKPETKSKTPTGPDVLVLRSWVLRSTSRFTEGAEKRLSGPRGVKAEAHERDERNQRDIRSRRPPPRAPQPHADTGQRFPDEAPTRQYG